jgi:hypothetical protein
LSSSLANVKIWARLPLIFTMSDLSAETNDGLRKAYESSLGICHFNKGEIAHAFQQQATANPAFSKFLPQLDFHGAKGFAQIGGMTGASDIGAMHGASGLPALAGDMSHLCDPSGFAGLLAALMKFMESLGAALPDAESLLDPSIAGAVAEESAKKLLVGQ